MSIIPPPSLSGTVPSVVLGGANDSGPQLSGVMPGTAAADNWILVTGNWDDTGIWIDKDNWID